jgi:hypothetical protein
LQQASVARRPVRTVTMHEDVRVDCLQGLSLRIWLSLKIVSKTYKGISIIYDMILCGAEKGSAGREAVNVRMYVRSATLLTNSQ